MTKAMFQELLNRATPEAFKEAIAVYKELLPKLDELETQYEEFKPNGALALLPVLLIEYGRMTKKDET